MLTAEDEKVIARAVLTALGKWSAICFLCGLVVWLLWVIISNSGGVE